jgi:DNA topoisomerase I
MRLQCGSASKSGIRHELKITDGPGQKLFEYIDESGELRGISSSDVNEYLRAVSGHSLTAKDFRTWTGTVECAVALRDMGECDQNCGATAG